MKRSKRTLTDFPLTIVYIVALIILIIITVFAHMNGEIKRLATPVSQNGSLCGVTEPDHKNLLILDYTSINAYRSLKNIWSAQSFVLDAPSICVEKCPMVFEYQNDGKLICNKQLSDILNKIKGISDEYCSYFNFPTIEFLHYCIPNIKAILDSVGGGEKIIKFLNGTDNLEKINVLIEVLSKYKVGLNIIKDLNIIKRFIPLYVAASFLFCTLCIFTFGLGSYPLFFVLYLISLLSSVISCGFCWAWYSNLNMDWLHTIKLGWVQKNIEIYLKETTKQQYFTLAITFTIISLVILICGIFLSKSVRIACFCAKEASKAFLLIFTNAIIPVVSVSVQVGYVILWIYVILCLLTSGRKDYRFLNFVNGSFIIGEICPIGESVSNFTLTCIFTQKYTSFLSIIFIIVSSCIIIWGIFLTRGVCIYIVSYSYYQYFWKKKYNTCISSYLSVLKGVKTLFIYNIGSIIFGSLILMLFTVIAMVFEILIRIFKFDDNKILKVMGKWIRRILKRIQQFFEKLSEKAYIQVAISRTNFCKSAIEVISVTFKYPIVTIFITLYNFIFSFLAIVIVAIASAIFTFYHIKWVAPEIESPLVLSITFGVGSILISLSSISIYTTGITTLLYCLDHDSKVNDGSPEKPYRISEKLRKDLKIDS